MGFPATSAVRLGFRASCMNRSPVRSRASTAWPSAFSVDSSPIAGRYSAPSSARGPRDAVAHRAVPAVADAPDGPLPADHGRGGLGLGRGPAADRLPPALPRGAVQQRVLLNPHRYPVGLERTLHDRRTELILAARAHR